MPEAFNIYCDESCHLEHDQQPVMVLGAVWLPADRVREVNFRIHEIKRRHCLGSTFELKWTKVSDGKLEFYLDILDYFFDDDDLYFRAVVAPKDGLVHNKYNQTHDDWYYKMYFIMLKNIFTPEGQYRVFLDMKDTCGGLKVQSLHRVLCNNLYDFSRSIITDVQQTRAREVNAMQLTDFLIGAIAYVNRSLSGNQGKVKLVQRMKKRSGLSLTRSTLARAQKINLFMWHPRETVSD